VQVLAEGRGPVERQRAVNLEKMEVRADLDRAVPVLRTLSVVTCSRSWKLIGDGWQT